MTYHRIPGEGCEGPAGPLGRVLRMRNGDPDVSQVLPHLEPGIREKGERWDVGSRDPTTSGQ